MLFTVFYSAETFTSFSCKLPSTQTFCILWLCNWFWAPKHLKGHTRIFSILILFLVILYWTFFNCDYIFHPPALQWDHKFWRTRLVSSASLCIKFISRPNIVHSHDRQLGSILVKEKKLGRFDKHGFLDFCQVINKNISGDGRKRKFILKVNHLTRK